MISVSVQSKDFDVDAEYRRLQSGPLLPKEKINESIGAVAMMTGLVRQTPDKPLKFMQLEHYPGMTEASLQLTAEHAAKRWEIIEIRIIHRFGRLQPGDQIVFVGVSSAHRDAAFSACEYIMDVLKTTAPFWKKEIFSDDTSRWLDAKKSDQQRASRWEK